MKSKVTGYWLTTGVAAAGFAGGGIADLARAPALVAEITGLGYPSYVMSILGVWKVLGAVALVAPRLPRLKEWAYAGMIFDLSGALVSHMISGSPADKLLPPLLFAALVIGSWALRPESRKLPSQLPGNEADSARRPLSESLSTT